jgi:hypothetical protein
LFAGIATSSSAGVIAGALSGTPLLLMGLLITGVFLRDAWAWFVASPEERDTFRQEVGRLGGGPDQLRIGDAWGLLAIAGLAIAGVLCAALIPRHHGLIVPAMMIGSVLVAALLDVARGAWRSRPGARPPRS